MKIDKPDAVIQLTRTDNGVQLKTTHRRTAAYPLEQSYIVVGIDGDEPIRYRSVGGNWPAGTKSKAAELDELGLPLDISVRAARTALKQVGRPSGKNAVVAAAIRYRRGDHDIRPPA